MRKIDLDIAQKIAGIAHKPNLPPRAMFILIQRCIRISLRHRDQIREERRVFRREAGKLKGYLPFTQRQMDSLLEKSRAHRHDELKAIKQGLVGFGYNLMKDVDGWFKEIGFDGICDLLSINPVHRIDARLSSEQSLAGLIYVERLEGSASPKSEEWGSGGPLFEACFEAMMNWIRTAPEDDLPDLFGPGSPFSSAQKEQRTPETLQ
ncbi:hypothetical protein ACKUFS_16455 [Pseudomonas cannabina]|uniref:hypothetical protein n=1 Tax=Pseudomonas syringae group TaxID=136849 RepID=UPI0006B9ECF4|nr:MULTISPECIES: hypothetical protein [Pseudomonas syringae group]KPB72915.1 Uncharacterized protein AC507_0673 [Pseudomonas syringae pv. maculicola]QQN21016.1 hypothetical protein JGS08_20795 [Pseudomonas cannabina pv. alisalensis]